MLKKIVPVIVLAAFMAAPVATPVFAADKKQQDCSKLKGDAKAKCEAAAKKKK